MAGTDLQDALKHLYGDGRRLSKLARTEKRQLAGSGWERANYGSRNNRQKEACNFQEASAVLADHGFDCVWLTDDRDGADFVARHMPSGETIRVQMTSCLAVVRKYENKGLWIAFPVEEAWYLLEHDKLRDIVGERTPALRNRSWLEDGRLWWGKPTKALLAGNASYRIDP